MTKSKKIDAYETVTAAIIEMMERGGAEWIKGWATSPAALPRRVTGEAYRGINQLLLGMIGADCGFTSPTWMTFKQAKELGGMVRKGEKSSPSIYFGTVEADKGEGAGEGAGEADGAEGRRIPFARLYRVFNVDQIDGLPDRFAPPPAAAPVNPDGRNSLAESILRATGAQIGEDGGNRAYYRPATDSIHLPHFDQFRSADDYLTTLAHELCHWTGAKHRLDRNLVNAFGSKDYAREELIAELGAAFVCNAIGVAGGHIESHAAYLASWIQCLREDKRAIFRAASAAQAAADLVLAGADAAKPAPKAKAEPSRAIQLAQLKAASPMRSIQPQDGMADAPLFAAAIQPDLFAVA